MTSHERQRHESTLMDSEVRVLAKSYSVLSDVSQVFLLGPGPHPSLMIAMPSLTSRTVLC